MLSNVTGAAFAAYDGFAVGVFIDDFAVFVEYDEEAMDVSNVIA